MVYCFTSVLSTGEHTTIYDSLGEWSLLIGFIPLQILLVSVFASYAFLGIGKWRKT